MKNYFLDLLWKTVTKQGLIFIFFKKVFFRLKTFPKIIMKQVLKGICLIIFFYFKKNKKLKADLDTSNPCLLYKKDNLKGMKYKIIIFKVFFGKRASICQKDENKKTNNII